MINIHINEKYGITADKLNWIVYEIRHEKNKKTGKREERHRHRHFFPNLRLLNNFLGDFLLRQTDAQSAQELLDNSIEIRRMLDTKLKPLFERYEE